jgi:hypothetical protein
MPSRHALRSQSIRLVVAITLLATLAPAGAAARVRSREAARPAAAIAAAPSMRFEVNRGQTDGRVRFLARGGSYTAFLTDAGLVVSARAPQPRDARGRAAEASADGPKERVLRVEFAGASPATRVGGEGPAAPSNYLLGGDPSTWRTGVATFTRVRYRDVYPGVDAVFHGDASGPACTIEIAPGADASPIRLRYDGVEAGLATSRPGAAYQRDAAARRGVAARFAPSGDGEVALDLGAYDPSKALEVEVPAIAAAFLGGGWGLDEFADAAVDSQGAVYVVGTTYATDFPSTAGAYDTVNEAGDVFVSKLSPDGSTLVYSTFLGMPVDTTTGFYAVPAAVAVDGSGNVVLTGDTNVAIPTTPGSFDTTFGGSLDAFAVKLNATGTAIVYSTYLGGSQADRGTNVVADAAGSAFVVGSTDGDFPVTAGAYDTTHGGGGDAFLARLSPDGSALTYSTYLGAAGGDGANAVALDADGRAVVVGAAGAGFPTTPGAYDTTLNGGADGFVARVSADGSALGYSTYLGGTGNDSVRAVAVDGTGAAYVTGSARLGFPTTPGAYDTTSNGLDDAFVAKLTGDGSTLAYSTYVGSNGVESGRDVAVDASGRAAIVGNTGSPNFPVTAGAFDTAFGGVTDAFVTCLAADGSALAYSTFVSGPESDSAEAVAFAGDGSVVVAGQTWSIDFPTLDPLPGIGADEPDCFVVRLASDGASLIYGTRLGGIAGSGGAPDGAESLAVDSGGNVYVVGRTYSAGFPSTAGAADEGYNGREDAFVAKLSPDLTSLVYATYLGGNDQDVGSRIAVDASGNAFIAGWTLSLDFPTTAGAFDTAFNGFTNAFVAKLDPSGAALVYSTLLGGGDEVLSGLVVDAAGNAIVAGATSDADFPTTPGALDTTLSGTDGFVTKLSADGSALVFSTFVGDATDGFEDIGGLAIDGTGQVFVTGATTSETFPVTAGALDTTVAGVEAFVAKLNASGSALVYSTLLGGGSDEAGRAIAVDADGNAFVAGQTGQELGEQFPVTPGAYDTTHNGAEEVFVAKVSPTGSALAFSTLLGGSSVDTPAAVGLGADGSVYVGGLTFSADFPTTPGALATAGNGFVSRLSADGATLGYGSYLDGDVRGLVPFAGGDVAVAGMSLSAFPPDGFGENDMASAYVVVLQTEGFAAPGADTPGIYLGGSGSWFLRNALGPGPADVVFGYGPSGLGWTPLAGDWDGDGVDTPGLYDPSSGFFFLRNANSPGPADTFFGFGPGGLGWKPIAGDWDGDGDDTIGLYDPSNGFFYIRNANAPGGADSFFGFGPGGLGWAPVVGDWDGDGDTTIGLYDPSSGFFFIRNENAPGGADTFFGFGPGGLGWQPLVGDWDGDGDETIGLYDPSSGFFYIRNENAPGGADAFFGYGPPGATPLVGDWDGQ